MWARETTPLMRAINDGSAEYRTSTSASVSAASSYASVTAVSHSHIGTNMTGLGGVPPPQWQPSDLLPSEERYFENLPSAANLCLYAERPQLNSEPKLHRPGDGSDKEVNVAKGKDSQGPAKSKMVMPSIPRLIVLMMAQGTGIPLKDVKIKTPAGVEIKQCFCGKVGVDWILSVMPRIKNRGDCLHIAQQLVEQQLILPLKPPKSKSQSPDTSKFLDDDNAFYFFTSETDIITGTFRADLGAPSAQSQGHAFERSAKGYAGSSNTEEPLNQFLAPPKVTSAMRNFLLDMSNPHTGVRVSSHNINSTIYANCFSGVEAVDWMMARMGSGDRDGAIKILQSMLTKNREILLSVYPATRLASTTFVDNNTSLYTFCSVANDAPPILEDPRTNSASIVPSSPPKAQAIEAHVPPPPHPPSPPRDPSLPPLSQISINVATPQLHVKGVTMQLPQPSVDTYAAPITSQSHPQTILSQPQHQFLPSQPVATQQIQPEVATDNARTASQLQPDPPALTHSQPPLHMPSPFIPQAQAMVPQVDPYPPQPQPQVQYPSQHQQHLSQTPQPLPTVVQPKPSDPPEQKENPQLEEDKSNAKNSIRASKNPVEPTVSDWLNSIKCPHLIPIFDSEDITFDIIPIMDYSDLEALGIHPSDIKVLIKHINILKNSITKQAEDKLKQNKKKK